MLKWATSKPRGHPARSYRVNTDVCSEEAVKKYGKGSVRKFGCKPSVILPRALYVIRELGGWTPNAVDYRMSFSLLRRFTVFRHRKGPGFGSI